jgi:hypothetical protein
MRRCRRLLLAASTLAVFAALSTTAAGQTTWGGFRLFKQVEADANNAYPLTERNGPWMIMVATFAAGEPRDDDSRGKTPEELAAEREKRRQEAAAQAQELVYELRKEHKLEAYTFVQKFNHNDGVVQGRGLNRYGGPQRMRYQRKPVAEEIAVLVGNYPAIDAPEAERDLKIIKDIEPRALSLPELAKQKRRTYQQLVSWRLSQKIVTPEQFKAANSHQKWGELKHLQINNTTRQFGPMGSAFITRNPMLPNEDVQGPYIDKVVYDMNKEVRYSLLDCPGKYTVQVARFAGATVVDQKRIREVQKGQAKLDSRLDEAAINAHKLTEALRLKGFEAYEFHDRSASFVMVGSFDSVGTPRSDGKIEINPKIYNIMRTFAPDPGGKPKTLVDIPFAVQPIPVTVPRRSISADYVGGGLLGWK